MFAAKDKRFLSHGGMDWLARALGAGRKVEAITYLLAFERGDSPVTILADIPTEFYTQAGPYHPTNYSRHYQGPVSIRESLAYSLNIPSNAKIPQWQAARCIGISRR